MNKCFLNPEKNDTDPFGRFREKRKNRLTLTLNTVQLRKCSAFASSALLHLFFTSNSAVIVDGGAKSF